MGKGAGVCRSLFCYNEKMKDSDKLQKIYNNIGILLVIGIVGGTGLLLVKYSDDNKEPIKIIQPKNQPEIKTIDVKASAKIDINTASLEDLDKLKGVGPATAQKIVDFRTQNGIFKKIEDIMNVPGIGGSKFQSIKDEISI